MSNVISFPKRSQDQSPADLSQTDIELILTSVKAIEGKWSARFVRIQHEESWAYVYCYGPTDDCTPTFSITRRGSAYTVVSWHLIDFVLNGGFSEYTGDLVSALQFIKLLAEQEAGKVSTTSVVQDDRRQNQPRRSSRRGKKPGLAAAPAAPPS